MKIFDAQFVVVYFLCVEKVFSQIFAPDVSTCHGEISHDDFGNAIIWNSTNDSDDSVESSPLCLDEERFVRTRQCTEQGWIPVETPACSFSQISFEDANKCPLGYDELKWREQIICVLLTPAQPWNNTCLSTGSSKTILDLESDERESVFKYLLDHKIQHVWMPAKRFFKYGLLQWTLLGDIYGESVEFEDIGVEIINEIYGDGCFSLNVSSGGLSGSVEACDTQHPVLCIYYEEKPLIQLACPPDFLTSRYEGHQDVCYSTHKIRGTGNRARQSEYSWVSSECRGELYSMTSVEKTVIYENLASRSDLSSSDRCLFGVVPNVYIENPTQWKALVPFVEYVNWAKPRAIGNIVAADREGKWHWTNDVFTCIACERQVQIQNPQISLKFHNHRLYAIVYNQQFLWREKNDEPGLKCFTDADDELIRTVKVEDEVWSGLLSLDEDYNRGNMNEQFRNVYELKTYGDGPGYYWCHGHAIPNFKLIETDRVVAYKTLKGEVFAVLVETSCINCRQYFQNKYIKQVANRYKDYLNDLRKQFKSEMDDEISVENVRVMRIVSIDLPKNVSTLLFHVTISIDDDFNDSGHNYVSADMIQIYKIRNYLHDMLTSTVHTTVPEYKYISLNNTEYCLPDPLSEVTNLSWASAKIGETTAPIELCLLPNGLPVLRKCVGDFIYGGKWLNFTRPQQCHLSNMSPITEMLYDIDKNFISPNETADIIQNLTELISSTNQRALIAADLFYMGKVMNTITKFNNDNPNATLLKRNESENIFRIYNRLMLVNKNTTKLSAALNSTNILLDAFDNIINHISSSNLELRRRGINITENLSDGTIAIVMPKLIVYVIDPMIRNVSGIALIRRLAFDDANEFKNNSVEEDFFNFDIRLLYTNQSTTQLLEEDGLEIASFLPQNLLNRLPETTNLTNTNDTTSAPAINNITYPAELPPIKIVITIYYNDLLFQEFKATTYAKPGGKIISVSIPGYGPILPDLLPIYIKTSKITDNTTTNDVCGYWNFLTDGWSNDGCEYGGSSGYFEPTILCACSHLTHFAYLVLGTYFHTIDGDDDVVITEHHQDALDLITLSGCSLSLVGIIGIAVTALVFPTWREKASSKVLLHLSAAISLQMILFCFVNTEVRSMDVFLNKQWYSCVLMGAFLHYSVLVAFTWMLITAYLQFMRYVRVIGHVRSNRFFLKSFFFGWGIPLIPVFLVVFIVPNSYIPDLQRIDEGICYPTGYALYLGVIVPMGLIIAANLIIFILVIYNILRGPDGKLRSNERDLSLAQLRLTILLFFLLGLTWIFGFCASTQAGLVFSYLFCLTATLQGFVLFLYFIVLDPITRNLWGNFLKRYLGCSTSNKNDLK